MSGQMSLIAASFPLTKSWRNRRRRRCRVMVTGAPEPWSVDKPMFRDGRLAGRPDGHFSPPVKGRSQAK